MESLELWYFYGKDCSICHALWPKVKAWQEQNFPKLKLRYLDAQEHAELAGQHRMLSVPGILFFVEGREYFRANGFLQFEALERQVSPAYSAFFPTNKS